MTHDHPSLTEGREHNRRRLAWTLGLVVAYMAAEVIGGWLANSLALLADAGHMLSDALSLGLALFALKMAERPATPERTFGYHRAEILAALANGATLVAISGVIFHEAWQRFQDPPEVQGGLMMAVAAGGLVVNLVGLFLLHGGRSESLNVRGAWLHVMTDTLGSIQALVAGALIWVYDWTWVDPLASVLIGLLVLWSSWALLRDSVHVLMEATPREINLEDVEAALEEIEGVEDVHDLHVWTITSGFVSLAAHVWVSDIRPRVDILREIKSRLAERFGIDHSTLQLEPEDFGPCEVCGSDRSASDS